jgi:hypothetical protein
LELSFKFCNFGDGAGVDVFYAALVHFYARTKSFYQFPKVTKLVAIESQKMAEQEMEATRK